MLLDRDMKKKDLQEAAGLSGYAMLKLGRDENVTTEVLGKICGVLNCTTDDIMEFIPDKKTAERIKQSLFFRIVKMTYHSKNTIRNGLLDDKQQLANRIWESANKMRSKIEANEYKDYILGFIFYKYLSDKEVKFLIENDYTDELLPTVTEDDDETVRWVQQNLGYFISYNNLFSTWISIGRDFDVQM